MMDKDKQFNIAMSMHHFFESLMYIELIRSNRRTPVLEFGNDMDSYQTTIKKEVTVTSKAGRKKQVRKVPLIHVGVAFFEAESRQDLFWQIHYMLGHETQHARSTTEKDWNAAHQLCLQDACQKLARDVLGKSKVRLVSDADYNNFFKDLADHNVFINREVLMNAIHYVINTLEDGRIENIRCRRHPGFAKYRKLFRGMKWMEADVRDKGHTADVSLMEPGERLEILFQDMYFLATCNIHQKGFLSMYAGTELYDRMHDKVIPEISKAVLARNCRTCMEHARIVFNEFLDEIIESCKMEADLNALCAMIMKMLQEISSGTENEYSESVNNEETGDGLPSESVFGTSDLEIEVDEETYEKMKAEMEENGDDMSEDDMAIKVVVKKSGDGDSDESDEKDATDSDEKGEGEAEQMQDKPNSEGSDSADQSKDSSSGDKQGEGSQGSGNSESGKSDEQGEGNSQGSDSESKKVTDSSASGEESAPQHKKNSAGTNNKDISHSADVKADPEVLEQQILQIMEAAAASVEVDSKAAEADRRKAEEVSKAAMGLNPVQPANVDLSGLSAVYGDVDLHENVRIFEPVHPLPFELENKGRSLSNKVDEMIRNKRSPDQRGMRAGSFDASRAHILLRGELTIYKKRGTYDKPDVAGYILIDNSGSMGNGEGSTRYYACNAAAVIEEGFKDHMPLKIAAFDAHGSRDVTHEVIKEFDENVKPNLAYNFKLLGRSGAGNKDGFSIRVATKQLLERSEKDKILIIMSDGYPSEYDGGYDEGCRDVKEAVEEAKKAGIKTIGMYMYHYQDEEDFAMYRRMYGEDCIFAGMDEIEGELERVFKRLFK